MTASRTWLAAFGALALAVAGFMWLERWERGSTVAPKALASDEPAETGIEERAHPDSTRDYRESVAGAAVPAEAVPHVAVVGEEAAEETWILGGRLVRDRDGSPVPSLIVALADVPLVTSDSNGRFELELSVSRQVRGSRAVLQVMHGSGATLLREERLLEPGLELRVDDEVEVLHGRVVDPTGAAIGATGVSLACRYSDGTGRTIGRAPPIDAEGTFRVTVASTDLNCDPVGVNVGLGQTIFPSSASLAALRSREGATVVLDLCTLSVEVRLGEGGPPAEAEVNLVGWRQGAEKASVISFPTLDADGGAVVHVERDAARVEIGVGAEGYVPWIEERSTPPCGMVWRVELRALGAGDVLEGVVLGADGRPVRDAFASCSPPARDDQFVAVPAIRGQRTDANGRFTLQFAADSTGTLMAYHRDHGSTEELLVHGGQRDLVLRFRPVARLDVRVTKPDGEDPGFEPTRFALEMEGGAWQFDQRPRGRVDFEEVPAGSHTLLCLTGDGLWWGRFVVEVFGTGPQDVQRTLEPARWAEGVLVDAAGDPLAGIELRNLASPLPRDAAWNPFVAVSGPDGRFRVLLGSDADAEFVFVRAGAELARARLSAGDAGELRVAP